MKHVVSAIEPEHVKVDAGRGFGKVKSCVVKFAFHENRKVPGDIVSETHLGV
jgi:hypothetical protein